MAEAVAGGWLTQNIQFGVAQVNCLSGQVAEHIDSSRARIPDRISRYVKAYRCSPSVRSRMQDLVDRRRQLAWTEWLPFGRWVPAWLRQPRGR
jgi:hypothetical protein